MRHLFLSITTLTLAVACSPGEPPAPDGSADAPATNLSTDMPAESISVTDQNYAHAGSNVRWFAVVRLAPQLDAGVFIAINAGGDRADTTIVRSSFLLMSSATNRARSTSSSFFSPSGVSSKTQARIKEGMKPIASTTTTIRAGLSS